MHQDKTTQAIAGILVASGFVHLVLWFGSGSAWEGAVSLRKPALFGVSGGLTVWSLGWVLSCLRARSWEHVASRLVAGCLLVEVALITIQYWRGVPSHFNEATTIDRLIEQAMLVLIALATVWIAWLCVRTFGPIERTPAMRLAIRTGMVYLLVSCLLGFATTILGKVNLTHGQSYEVWGRAGVLKFPHGMALHAIQFLPLAAWLAERLRFREPVRIVQGLAAAQMWLLAFALYQTLTGRARTELSTFGIFMLAAAIVSATLPLLLQKFKQKSPN